MKKSILIVDDQANILKLLSFRIEQLGFIADTANNGYACMNILKQKEYAVVLMDIQMPVKDGITTLVEIKENYPNLPVIMVTAQDDISQAVKAVKLGAFEYLTKPVDFDRLETEIANAVELGSLRTQVSSLKKQLHSSELFSNIIGKSKAITDVFKLADFVLQSDVNILIIGESGTGKELMAKAIHDGSNRRKQMFVPVNSAAIPRELSDSLIFGHKKGSFTGANEDRKGYFEQANGGTIFLDEIGDMEMDTQAKILRILEERTVRRVGEKKEISLDSRIIAATNRDLADLIREGRFRKDLYYRLEEYPIYLPSLRERKSDIILLAQHFLREFCQDNNTPIKSFSSDVEDTLKNHLWPGNIRELKNVVRRAAIRCRGEVIEEITFSKVESMPAIDNKDSYSNPPKSINDEIVPFEKVERDAIEHAYYASDQNALEAARHLGISRATIYRKLKQFDIE